MIQPPLAGEAREAWEQALAFRCTECGDCCRGSLCVVTDADVRRLACGAQRAASTFLRFVSPHYVFHVT